MDIKAAVTMQLQAQSLDAARASIVNAQQQAAAGAAAQPAVILELSAAAQALTGQ
jgi:hypothetical protein